MLVDVCLGIILVTLTAAVVSTVIVYIVTIIKESFIKEEK